MVFENFRKYYDKNIVLDLSFSKFAIIHLSDAIKTT